MAPKRYEDHMPGQEAFFADPAEVVVEMPDMINLDLRECTRHTISTLGKLAEVSQKAGFQKAMDTSHRQELEDYYQGGLEAVAEGVQRRQLRAEKDAKIHFAMASGTYVLLAAAKSPEERKQITDEARVEYELFKSQYGGSENRKYRDKYRRELNSMLKPSKRRSHVA